MNSQQIASVLNSDCYSKTTFRGVYPRNKLPHLIASSHRPVAYVINTDHSDGPGKHWVGVWFDTRGRAEYFDSFGFPPTLYPDIESFILRNSRSYRYSSVWIQDWMSSNCGFYVLYFILQKSRGCTLGRLMSIFHPRQLVRNDQRVIQRVHWMIRP